MANLKARFLKVKKATDDLIFVLPKDIAVKFPQFLSEDQIEIKKHLKLPIPEKTVSNDSYIFCITRMLKDRDLIKITNDPKIAQAVINLKDSIEAFCYNPHKKNSKAKPEVPICDKQTRELKSELKKTRQEIYTSHQDDISDPLKKEKELKSELSKREHIPSSTQAKLIRKMSIHAGKKLTLQEAQILNNNLSKKSKK